MRTTRPGLLLLIAGFCDSFVLKPAQQQQQQLLLPQSQLVGVVSRQPTSSSSSLLRSWTSSWKSSWTSSSRRSSSRTTSISRCHMFPQQQQQQLVEEEQKQRQEQKESSSPSNNNNNNNNDDMMMTRNKMAPTTDYLLQESSYSSWPYPSSTYYELSSGYASLPYTIDVTTRKQNSNRRYNHYGEDNNMEDVAAPARPSEELMTIRIMTSDDIREVTDICMDEYAPPKTNENNVVHKNNDHHDGSGVSTSSAVDTLGTRIDRMGLRVQVDWSFRLKTFNNYACSVSQQKQQQQNQRNQQQRRRQQDSRIPDDHVVLLAVIDNEIVGMIEVSKQPVVPDRNPPAFPVPLPIKSLIGRRHAGVGSGSGSTTQGWITNLLVIPQCRKCGIATLLVTAAEGIARIWNCTSIHLHCDADPIRGRASQRLYMKLGYYTINLCRPPPPASGGSTSCGASSITTTTTTTSPAMMMTSMTMMSASSGGNHNQQRDDQDDDDDDDRFYFDGDIFQHNNNKNHHHHGHHGHDRRQQQQPQQDQDGDHMRTGVVFIDGVPLLYLRKNL